MSVEILHAIRGNRAIIDFLLISILCWGLVQTIRGLRGLTFRTVTGLILSFGSILIPLVWDDLKNSDLILLIRLFGLGCLAWDLKQATLVKRGESR